MKKHQSVVHVGFSLFEKRVLDCGWTRYLTVTRQMDIYLLQQFVASAAP